MHRFRSSGSRPPIQSSFLSWAGSKRRLIPQIETFLPTAFRRYFEPFCGSAGLFFHLQPRKACLSDTNIHLIDTFVAVRDGVEGVITQLARFGHGEREYYRVRDDYRPRSDVARAARFIYLNKTCWNGLYRENLRGEFNTPFGMRRTAYRPDRDLLRRFSTVLAGASLLAVDFEEATASADAGDLVYFDPPYTTAHTSNGFVEYNAKVFSWRDQKRLASWAIRLAGKGVQVVVSNADHPSITQLYDRRGFARHRLHRHSTVAGAGRFRYATTELLIVSS